MTIAAEFAKNRYTLGVPISTLQAISHPLANIAITVPLTVLFVVHYKLGPLGLLVGNFSGTLIVFGVLLAYRREQLGFQFDRKLLRAVNRFGLPLVPSALALWVTNFGDRFMLIKLTPEATNLTQVGQYSLAVNIGAGPHA